MFHNVSLVRRGLMYLLPKNWLRPNGRNLKQMKILLRNCILYNKSNVEFMLHSSELMPGGSPRFKTEQSIEKLYSDLELLFIDANNNNFEGCTLSEFYQHFLRRQH
ncbi:MAG: hypothetical protein OMM_10648 [Candidatus Magnetoglobus multicellularis str. Araruama]|uniref:Uncharacterized protein n=1 Tax=Candidatus Magnetoglobus multicellularis str. Araruama TaxID=890399 RepID=A0A1V1P0H9_9BACT|nr:MAG: hypothetical protein OMM_10648 [Candidatus Magnetoglobus multicellularis str. Araruama]